MRRQCVGVGVKTPTAAPRENKARACLASENQPCGSAGVRDNGSAAPRGERDRTDLALQMLQVVLLHLGSAGYSPRDSSAERRRHGAALVQVHGAALLQVHDALLDDRSCRDCWARSEELRVQMGHRVDLGTRSQRGMSGSQGKLIFGHPSNTRARVRITCIELRAEARQTKIERSGNC